MTEHDIFAAAIKLSGDPRSAFLAAACGQDAKLREQVDALLRAHDESGGLLPRQADRKLEDQRLEATHLAASQAAPGTVIAGRYKLLEALGEGGMGTVWVAEQSQPVKRKVALKLIKAGMDSKSVLARFEAERQALTDDVIATVFAQQPTVDETQKAFLRKVISFYESFAAQSRTSEESRFLAADGKVRVAKILIYLGERTEAIALYRSVIRERSGVSPPVPLFCTGKLTHAAHQLSHS